MRTVHRFNLLPGKTELSLPVDAKILCARERNDDVSLWVLLDPDQVKKRRVFWSFGTGELVPDGLKLRYIDTVSLREKSPQLMFFHIFEEELSP